MTLWQGRFGDEGPADELLAYSVSVTFDRRLATDDIAGSRAHGRGLERAGVLTAEELTALLSALDAVERELTEGIFKFEASDEDVHTLIDRLLHDEIGEVASKLHTGRSRNDQVSTATRLWAMEACKRLDHALRQLQQVVVDRASSLQDAVMPGYTHMQRAIPVSAAHWLLSHFWPLERDRQRLRAAYRGAATLPLGSGAVAGCAYPISRTLLQGTLGFESLTPNSIDAVSDRDFVAELLFTCALAAAHLSRFAEDLIVYGTSEFGFVEFSDAFSTGRSETPTRSSSRAAPPPDCSAITLRCSRRSRRSPRATTRICRTTSECCSMQWTRFCS